MAAYGRYELMIKTNHHLIRGSELTDSQKATITRRLLAARIDIGLDSWLYDGAINAHKPAFFVLPYKKKLKKITLQSRETYLRFL